ncbi:pentapeptide repeat-containing protein [Thiomicrospira pelophila]|uniref:pentapeptide repeat-containing protein n=1 Tax=Thiomicrospira pelophila TaxID=934 RepID=UPI00138E2B72|nr:pentapeptide repeat-containing protein [Thiomicrospira pelophila]
MAHQDYKVKEQGHITDRINKAVEGLGAEKTVKQVSKDGKTSSEFTQPNLEVRIGSIYALERIAQDSLRDHIQIMEILCAYIRENALEPNHVSSKLRLDIQIALTVIGRRSSSQIKLERQKSYELDLSNLNLDKTVLKGLNFDRANFSNSTFEDADLSETSLVDANFYQVSFKLARMYKAKLDDAKLYHVKFENTLLPFAYVKNAEIGQACFSNNAQLDGIDFTKFKRFMWVTMRNVDLSRCKKIEQSQLNEIFADASVTLPEGMERPKHWSVEVLGNKFDEVYKAWRPSTVRL